MIGVVGYIPPYLFCQMSNVDIIGNNFSYVSNILRRYYKMPAAVGSRAQVLHGTAKHTSGGLTKSDLKVVKTGGKGKTSRTKIVSKKASTAARKSVPPQLKMWRDSLKEHGVLSKGTFTPVKKGTARYAAVKKIYNAKIAKAGL